MAMEPLPLGFGDFSIDASPFSLWPLPEHYHPQENVEELKQSLVTASSQLEATREEVRRKEQSIAKLVEQVRRTAKERDDARELVRRTTKELDDAREQLQHQLLLARDLVTSSATDSDSLVSSPVDPFFDPVTSSDNKHHQCHPNVSASANASASASANAAVFDMLAKNKPLPQKGRLLQAVMEAGPLLQNLLVAGPLPRWRNPPPAQALEALPLGVKGYANAPGVPILSADAASLAYGNVHMQAPTAAAAGCCSVSFDLKRQRLH